jgi:uncharacterized membrane protein
MEPVVTPNWLSIVGSCYLIFAFGFLAGSAGFRRGWNASPEVRQHVTDYGRRVLTFAAGITGLIGMLFQGLGQFVLVEHGTWFVIACLALVPILLAYVFLGDQMLETYRRTVETSAEAPRVASSQPASKMASLESATGTATGHHAIVAPIRSAAE